MNPATQAVLDRVGAVVGDIGYMTPARAEMIVDLIFDHKLTQAIEVGFAHGVSTSYIAAALEEASPESGALVTSIDIKASAELSPKPENFLDALGLTDRVDIYREATCATWRLMRMLDADPSPRFDLFFLDGAHTWAADGFLFFLVDRLMRPGGWIVLDDLNWTLAGCPESMARPEVAALPIEQRDTAQVGKVYDLLIRTHPGYGNFRVDGQWAFAQKLSEGMTAPAEVPRREVVYKHSVLSHLADLVLRRPAR